MPAVVSAPVVVKKETDFDKAVKPLNLSKSDKDALLKIFNDSSSVKDISKRKQSISNTITQTFGNSKSSKYYQALKPLIK